jgi:hypothetical protein
LLKLATWDDIIALTSSSGVGRLARGCKSQEGKREREGKRGPATLYAI